MSNFSEQTGRPILGSLEEIYGYITKRHDTIMFELQESVELQTKMIPVVEKAKLSGISNVYIKSIPPFVCNELTESFVGLMSENVTMCFIANTIFDTFDDDFVSKIFSVFKTRNSLRDLFVSVSLMNNKSARLYLSGRNKLKHINFSLDFSDDVGAFRFCVEEIKNTPLSISCTFRDKTEWDKLATTLKFIKKPVPISVLTFHYVFCDVGGILPVFRKLSNWSIDTVWIRSCVVPLPIEILKNVRRVEIGLGEVDWDLFATQEAINVVGEKIEGSIADLMVFRCKESALVMLRNLKASNHQKLKMVICTLDGPDIARELKHFQEPRLVSCPESEPVKRPRRPRVFLPKDKEAVIAECFSEPLADTSPTTSVEESEEDIICSDQLCTKSVIKSTDYFYELVCSSPDKHIVRYHKACKRTDVPCHCGRVWQVCNYLQESGGERTVKHTEVLVDDNSVLESVLTSDPQPVAGPDPEPELEAELEAETVPEPEPVVELASAPKITIHKPKFVFEKSKQTRRAEVANEFKIKRNSKATRPKKQTLPPAKQASSPAEQVCDALLKKGFFSPLEECQGALDRSLSSVSLATDLLLSWHRQQSLWSEE